MIDQNKPIHCSFCNGRNQTDTRKLVGAVGKNQWICNKCAVDVIAILSAIIENTQQKTEVVMDSYQDIEAKFWFGTTVLSVATLAVAILSTYYMGLVQGVIFRFELVALGGAIASAVFYLKALQRGGTKR